MIFSDNVCIVAIPIQIIGKEKGHTIRN